MQDRGNEKLGKNNNAVLLSKPEYCAKNSFGYCLEFFIMPTAEIVEFTITLLVNQISPRPFLDAHTVFVSGKLFQAVLHFG